MSLACKISGHKWNSVGVCYRCGARCDHADLELTAPCLRRCTACGKTFENHNWEPTGEPGVRRCRICGKTIFNPAEAANRKAAEQGLVNVRGNLKPDQNALLIETVRLARKSSTDPYRTGKLAALADGLSSNGYVKKEHFPLLIEAVEELRKLYASMISERAKYDALKRALEDIGKTGA